MTAEGKGRSPAYNDAMVDDGSSCLVATRPQKPWVSELCGSLSTSSTRRPSFDRAPARWWQVDVLPTPPFMLTDVMTTDTVRPSVFSRCTVHRIVTKSLSASWWTV